MESSIDREKVIKGLHCCSHTDGVNCIYCPYDNSDSDCTALMAMDVLALLKEQEAVEPDTDSEGTCSCGNCGTTVGYYPVGRNVPEKLCKFCPHCGQEVKLE